jgi:uncharacterized membrane protein YeaQ/YmgE (transglycosylase-associated protein family)
MVMLETNSLIVILVVGLIAGWLAGKIMRGRGFGVLGDILVGIIGAFVGAWLWGQLHMPLLAGSFWINAVVVSTVGAVVVLFLIGLLKRA